MTPSIIVNNPNTSVTVTPNSTSVQVNEGDSAVTVPVNPNDVTVDETEKPITVGLNAGPMGPEGPAGTSDGRVAFDVQAAETLSGHRAVTPNPDGTVSYADTSTIGNQPVWVTTQSAVLGAMVNVVSLGPVEEVSWNWAIGNVYLAANGVLTQVQPTSGALVVVGEATSPTTLYVDRQATINL